MAMTFCETDISGKRPSTASKYGFPNDNYTSRPNLVAAPIVICDYGPGIESGIRSVFLLARGSERSKESLPYRK